MDINFEEKRVEFKRPHARGPYVCTKWPSTEIKCNGI
jgi:hypothetical protein